ncbi:MAG TPA: hypothetical protein VGP36_17395, partial [Mycobacteriales bacterium]|nr:hypothetical protein [Mycobacteriales bacterium]
MTLARPRTGRPGRVTKRRTALVLAAALGLGGVTALAGSTAVAAPGAPFVQGVTFPFNGVWLESTDGGHYWDAGGNGLCR